MKRLLHFTSFACFILLFIGCRKTIEAFPQPAYNPLTGTWYLYDASIYDNRGSYKYDPGLYGNLSFYPSGNAQYDDGSNFLQGNWNITNSYDGYYDYNGYYHTDLHQSLSVYLNGQGNSSINLYFDDISFEGSNQFTATYYTHEGIQRYIFRRN